MSLHDVPAFTACLLHAIAGEPFLVAIDGDSAAGKSTLSCAVAAAVQRCQMVPGRYFCRVVAPEQWAALSPPEGYEQYFDWQRLVTEVLHPLRPGVVIIERVRSARPELVGYYNVVIYVKMPGERRRQVQRERGMRWNGSSGGQPQMRTSRAPLRCGTGCMGCLQRRGEVRTLSPTPCISTKPC